MNDYQQKLLSLSYSQPCSALFFYSVDYHKINSLLNSNLRHKRQNPIFISKSSASSVSSHIFFFSWEHINCRLYTNIAPIQCFCRKLGVQCIVLTSLQPNVLYGSTYITNLRELTPSLICNKVSKIPFKQFKLKLLKIVGCRNYWQNDNMK